MTNNNGGNEMTINTEKAKKYNYIGVRVVRNGEIYTIGDVVNNSKDWDFENDNSSDVDLDGASAIEVADIDFDETEEAKSLIIAAANVVRDYGKGQLVIIASNDVDYGDDPGEIVMSNAVVVGVID